MWLLQAPASATHCMMDNGLWWKQKLAFSHLSCIVMHSPELAAVFSGRIEKCISLFFQKESFQWRFWRLLFFIFQLTFSLSFSLWMPVLSWHVFIYFLYLKCFPHESHRMLYLLIPFSWNLFLPWPVISECFFSVRSPNHPYCGSPKEHFIWHLWKLTAQDRYLHLPIYRLRIHAYTQTVNCYSIPGFGVSFVFGS